MSERRRALAGPALLLVLLLLLLLAVAAAAQEDTAAPPDVPSGTALLEGRIVDADGEGVGGGGVILYSLGADGEPGLRQTRADEEGRFRFESISGDPEVVYLVGTRLGGVPFGARARFEAGQTLQRVEIEVSEPSRDVSGVEAGPPALRLARGCSHLRVHHQQELRNPSSQVVYVPAEDRSGAEPLFELLLPEGATEIETPMGSASDGFEREGRVLRFFGPLYPGEARVEFAYGLPLSEAGALQVGFPDGAPGVSVWVPADGARVSGQGLREAGMRALPEGAHRELQSDALPPGGSVALEVQLAEGADADFQVLEARLWVEVDDAALDVNEMYQLRVDGDAPLAATGQAPLACLPLPPGATGLRFSNAALAMGLSRDPGGDLAIAGPIPAGDSNLSLRYALPTDPGPVDFVRSFPEGADLLTLLVADTGLVPETERLHRRRPIRTEDRSYLHLEAFGIGRGEEISVTLHPLPASEPLPGLASTGFVLAVAVGALFYLIAPLREEPGAAGAEPAAAAVSTERQAVYATIDALDEDFETGKLSQEDHTRMRAELRARAVALLQQERSRQSAREASAAATQPAGSAEAAPAGACAACGAGVSAGARFCSQCGAPLSSHEDPPGAGAS